MDKKDIECTLEHFANYLNKDEDLLKGDGIDRAIAKIVFFEYLHKSFENKVPSAILKVLDVNN